jgi:ABC-2 type transport system permease protein
VIVLLGVFRVMVGLVGALIAPNMRSTMEDVRSGGLDFLLAKPVNAQFYASFRQWVLWRGIDAVIGVGLIIGGCVALSERVTLLKLGAFVITLAAGAVIVYSFWLFLATTVFWFTRLANIEMVFWNVFHAGRYPLDVYSPRVRWALTYILPLGFLTTFPAAALVGRAGSDMLLASAIVAPLALLAATAFWRVGVRSYSGASA